MFLGSYKPSFDISSRRIALPKKIRDELSGNEIILSFGFENCIFGYDTKRWSEESKKRLSEPLISRGARDIRRLFFSSAERINLDNQGRFIISGVLYKFAKIKKPIIIGAGDHFEIWEQSIWYEESKKLERVE
jgi:MraZ protein